MAELAYAAASRAAFLWVQIPPGLPEFCCSLTIQRRVGRTVRHLSAKRGFSQEASGFDSVHLTKRVQTADGLRYCPVVTSANGRIKPDVVVVDGRQERHPEGAYYLEWREDGKRVRLSVGKDAADASARRQRKEAELNAVNNGVSVVPENGQNGHRSLTATIAEYLEETRLSKKPKTHAAYSTALSYFAESCHKLNLADVERKDMLRFAAFLGMRKSSHHAARTTSSRT